MQTVFILLTFIIIQSNCYYLIELNRNYSSIKSYCSIEYFEKNLYHIPERCHRHVECHSSHCDDRQFRCVKLRETLCCLYEYIREKCLNINIKERFRSIYFHLSIQHGYCEINLERIEQQDQTYCLNNYIETTTITVSYSSIRSFQQIQSKSRTVSARYQFFIICFFNILVSK